LGEEDPVSFNETGGDGDLSVLESLLRGELGDISVTVFSDLDIILERGDLGEVGGDEVAGPNRLSIVVIGFSDLDILFPVDRGEVGGDETAVGIDTVILSAFDPFGRLVNNIR